MPPPGVQPAATRKSITDQLLAGNIPRAQARAAIESGEIDGAIAALVINQAPAAPTIVAATVARPATPSGVVSTLGGAAPPAVAAPAPADEQAPDAVAEFLTSGPTVSSLRIKKYAN